MIYDISPVNNHKGNGTNKIFDFDFYIENENQLKVYFYNENNIKEELKNNLDYTINEFKNNNGSYITYPIENSKRHILSEKEKLSIELNLSIEQQTKFNNSSLLNLSTLEYCLDYLTRLVQILSRKIDRCVKVDEISSQTPEELIKNINNNSLTVQNYLNNCSEIYKNVLTQSNELNSIYNYILEKHDKFETIDLLTESLAIKANLELDNITQDAKSNLSGLSMPDYSRIEAKSFDTSYQAECDGYVFIVGLATSNGYVTVQYSFDGSYTDLPFPNMNNSVLSVGSTSGAAIRAAMLLPCPSGIYYKLRSQNISDGINQAWFIKAKGAK